MGALAGAAVSDDSFALVGGSRRQHMAVHGRVSPTYAVSSFRRVRGPPIGSGGATVIRGSPACCDRGATFARA